MDRYDPDAKWYNVMGHLMDEREAKLTWGLLEGKYDLNKMLQNATYEQAIRLVAMFCKFVEDGQKRG